LNAQIKECIMKSTTRALSNKAINLNAVCQQCLNAGENLCEVPMANEGKMLVKT